MSFLKNVLQVSIIMVVALSCNQGNKKTPSVALSENEETEQSYSANPDSLPIDSMEEGVPVFYNMYLSVDMSSLFNKENAVYRPEIANPVEKAEDYVLSSKKALNLGVYAVDLNYIKQFEQYDELRSYFAAMHSLSSALGIPDDYFFNTVERFENNMTNEDSLMKIANEVYNTTEVYLKENERENASSLIVLGGWTEALYIATQIVGNNEEDDAVIMERIAEQKYSIQELITLLENHGDDEFVASFITRLKEIEHYLEAYEVNYDDVNASYENLEPIIAKITELRKEIVS
ncbi:MAG: hypothetical protein ACOCW8_01060 [bacterium]